MRRVALHVAVPLLAIAAACSSGSNDDAPAIDDAEVLDDASVAPIDGGSDAVALDAGPPPIGDCPMGPSPGLPPESPRILVIAPASSGPELLLRHLRGIFGGDPAFTAPEIVLQLTDTSTDWKTVSLAGFWYSPGGREARIAPLAGPFTWVVMFDDARVALAYPELHFEGVRVVACRARAAGATPILLQAWTPAATDAASRGEIAYRVGNGTGTPVLPVAYAWEAAQSLPDGGAGAGARAGAEAPPLGPVQPPSTLAAYVGAASVYHAITGRSAATTTYQPPEIADRARLAAAAEQAIATHATKTHYTAPFASAAVRRRTMASSSELWFMTSGTSSEAIYTERMSEILPKLGMIPKATAIGTCNDAKLFDEACIDLAKPSFASAQYQILFAREYNVSSATTLAAGMQTDLQVQVWDRQFDGAPADGAAAVASLEIRSMMMIEQSRAFDLAWIPYHLMFAKLKTARPAVQLTSDGTHATYPVGYALAAMSIESRTSLLVPTDGLDPDTAAAVRLGDETIRQLSTLSQWGTFVPDDPTTRPKVR